MLILFPVAIRVLIDTAFLRGAKLLIPLFEMFKVIKFVNKDISLGMEEILLLARFKKERE